MAATSTQIPPVDSPVKKPTTGGRFGVQTISNPADADMDIWFVHGLTGDRKTTWTHSNGIFTPDLIRAQFSSARIISYGYDANIVGLWNNDSRHEIRWHGKALAYAISNSRPNEAKRPLYFIAHSLGGLVTEQALLISLEPSEPRLQSIASCTAGIVFMGTPHSGASLATWGYTLARVLERVFGRNKEFLSLLRRRLEVLKAVKEAFQLQLTAGGALKHVKIFCFYETIAVDSVGFVVPEEYATMLPYPNCGIDANHMDMTKFTGLHDPGFINLKGVLGDWINRARRSKAPDTNANAGNMKSLAKIACSDGSIETHIFQRGTSNAGKDIDYGNLTNQSTGPNWINRDKKTYTKSKRPSELDGYSSGDSGVRLQTLEGRSSYVTSVAFSYDGTQLALGLGDNTNKVWDTSSGAYPEFLHTGKILSDLSLHHNSSCVDTDIGTVFTQSPEFSSTNNAGGAGRSLYQGTRLSGRSLWINHAENNRQWVPSESWMLRSSVSESTVIMGTQSGRAWICTVGDVFTKMIHSLYPLHTQEAALEPKNYESGVEMVMLLVQRGAGIHITEGVMRAAAANSGHHMRVSAKHHPGSSRIRAFMRQLNFQFKDYGRWKVSRATSTAPSISKSFSFLSDTALDLLTIGDLFSLETSDTFVGSRIRSLLTLSSTTTTALAQTYMSQSRSIFTRVTGSYAGILQPAYSEHILGSMQHAGDWTWVEDVAVLLPQTTDNGHLTLTNWQFKSSVILPIMDHDKVNLVLSMGTGRGMIQENNLLTSSAYSQSLLLKDRIQHYPKRHGMFPRRTEDCCYTPHSWKEVFQSVPHYSLGNLTSSIFHEIPIVYGYDESSHSRLFMALDGFHKAFISSNPTWNYNHDRLLCKAPFEKKRWLLLLPSKVLKLVRQLQPLWLSALMAPRVSHSKVHFQRKSSFRTWLFRRLVSQLNKVTRPEVAKGYRRIEWQCDCGVDLYADFPETYGSYIDKLARSLQGPGKQSQLSHREASQAQPTIPNGCSGQSGATGISLATSSSIQTPTAPSVAPFTGPPTLHSVPGPNNQTSSGSGVAAQGAAVVKGFIAFCVNISGPYKVCSEISMAQITNDSQLFFEMKRQYLEKRGRWARFNLLVRPITVEFIQFRFWNYQNSYISVCKRPNCIPPKNSKDYDFNPRTLEPPPMPPEVFIHYLQHDEDDVNQGRDDWISHLPKRVNKHEPRCEGYGMHVIEGPYKLGIFMVTMLVNAMTVTISVIYSVKMKDVQGGTGIGALIIACYTAFLTAWIFWRSS